MEPKPTDRTGLLIVRLWIEHHPTNGFRARITKTLDSAGEGHEMTTAGSPTEIYALVQKWVEDFISVN